MKFNEEQSRRNMLKSSALGLGLILAGENPCEAQFGRGHGPLPLSPNNPSIQHVRRNCRRCGKCREFCQNITTVFGRPVPQSEDACIHCGQCTLFCKANALEERFHYPAVSSAIADTDKILVASMSPAIRVALGEMFALFPGTNVEGKTVSALRRLGFDHVLDTTFAADLTVMEEASELINRLQNKDAKHPLPMFTSCCPGWVRFAKLFYPKLLPNISTTKSPVMMQGAMLKTYYARQREIDPQRIFHVALTPCTAKKAEILRPEMNAAGIVHGTPAMRDVDIVLTNRELGYLIKNARIPFSSMQDSVCDSLMGTGSGAGMIFGNSGGVSEAALRTAYWMLNGEDPPKEFYQLQPVRGLGNVREASVDLGKVKLKIAMIHGIGNSRDILDRIQRGETDYHFVEVMACPGGCIGGGGQPRNRDLNPERLRAMRSSGLWKRDIGTDLRLSHKNPDIRKIYEDFLGNPLGEKSEELLHTIIQ